MRGAVRTTKAPAGQPWGLLASRHRFASPTAGQQGSNEGMSGNEWRDDQRTRIKAWWSLLDGEAKNRMLALDEQSAVPADLAESLHAARVSFTETWREPSLSDLKAHQPSALREFLAEQQESAGQ